MPDDSMTDAAQTEDKYEPLRLENQLCFGLYAAAHAMNRAYRVSLGTCRSCDKAPLDADQYAPRPKLDISNIKRLTREAAELFLSLFCKAATYRVLANRNVHPLGSERHTLF